MLRKIEKITSDSKTGNVYIKKIGVTKKHPLHNSKAGYFIIINTKIKLIDSLDNKEDVKIINNFLNKK